MNRRYRIALFGHPGYGGAVLEGLLKREDCEVVCLVHQSGNLAFNLKRMLKRRFGTTKKVARSLRKMLGNLPKIGQERYIHPSTFKVIDPKPIAEALGIPCIDASQIGKPEFYEKLSTLSIDLILVASFGVLLPKALLDIPRIASINIHPGLLPRHRGGFPEYSALFAGDEYVGLTAHLMTPRFDDGPILMQLSLLAKDLDLLEIKRQMIDLAPRIVSDLLDDLALKLASPVHQDSSLATLCKYHENFNVVMPDDSVSDVLRKYRSLVGEQFELQCMIDGKMYYLLHCSNTSKGWRIQCRDGELWFDVVRRGRKVVRAN